MTLEELAEQRKKTEAVSGFLREQLAAHLETLRPLLAPERLLGKYAGGKTDVTGMELALSQLQEKYKPFTAKPYDLPLEFDPYWLTLIGNKLELHPWTYAYEVKGAKGKKNVTMTSPGRWILTYSSGFTTAQFFQALSGKEPRRQESIRQFMVNALTLAMVFARNPGIAALLAGLRYEAKVEQLPDMRQIPLVTLTACLPSFRPADDLILAATTFSGVPAFIEIIDLNAVRNLQDPLKAAIEQAAG